MKLFTIGDSISQGFMSLAAARTDQCYSTLLSRILNAENYNYPSWEKGGHPVNLEGVFRKLQERLGNNISGIFEWAAAFGIISKFLDDVEDYYERGKGSQYEKPEQNFFNNVSVRGFDLAASWMITPQLCRNIIEASKNKKDNLLGTVDKSLLRTALRVLEAGTNTQVQNPSQLDWLQHHHKKEGVENLILWLGANNALGTVLSLDIQQTSNDGKAFEKGPENVSYQERQDKKWNLWHPEDFKTEYEYMFGKVIKIMEDNPNNIDYKVFIGTIPLVTIAPLIKGVGGPDGRELVKVKEWRVDLSNPAPLGLKEVKDPEEKEYSYAMYYPYFPFAENFDIHLPHLNMVQALHIDNTIRQYNRIIIETVATANKKLRKKRFYLVDISSVLSDMALKRNNYHPNYQYPSYFDFVYPRVDTRYYGTTLAGKIMAGGIFSLDGVHPTAIGQGLLAYEFLKVMKQAGSYNGDVEKAFNWSQIFASDSLRTNPIALINEIYDNIEFKKWIVNSVIKYTE